MSLNQSYAGCLTYVVGPEGSEFLVGVPCRVGHLPERHVALLDPAQDVFYFGEL